MSGVFVHLPLRAKRGDRDTGIMMKEWAKFFAGVTAWEAIVHASLGLSRVLPIKLMGVNLTPKINTVQVVLPALSSGLLVYYGWFHRASAPVPVRRSG